MVPATTVPQRPGACGLPRDAWRGSDPPALEESGLQLGHSGWLCGDFCTVTNRVPGWVGGHAAAWTDPISLTPPGMGLAQVWGLKGSGAQHAPPAPRPRPFPWAQQAPAAAKGPGPLAWGVFIWGLAAGTGLPCPDSQ